MASIMSKKLLAWGEVWGLGIWAGGFGSRGDPKT